MPEHKRRTLGRALVGLGLVCVFFAVHTHFFLSLDSRHLVDHDWFYTKPLIGAHAAGQFNELVTGHFDYPPLYQAYQYLALSVGKPSLYNMKMANLLFHFLILLAAFLIGRELGGDAVGLVAAFVVGAMPPYFDRLHKLTLHYHTYGLCVLGLYLSLRQARLGRRAGFAAWLGIGLLFTAGIMIHPIALVFAVIAFVVLLTALALSPRKLAPRFLAGFALALAPLWLIAKPWLTLHLANYDGNYGGLAGSGSPGIGAALAAFPAQFWRIFNGADLEFSSVSWPLQTFALILPVVLLPIYLKFGRDAHVKRSATAYLAAGWIVFALGASTAHIGPQLVLWSAFYILFIPVGLALAHNLLCPETDPPPRWAKAGRLAFGALAAGLVLYQLLFVFYVYMGSFTRETQDTWAWADRHFFHAREMQTRELETSMLHFHLTKNSCVGIIDALTDALTPGDKINVLFEEAVADEKGVFRRRPLPDGSYHGGYCSSTAFWDPLYFAGITVPQHSMVDYQTRFAAGDLPPAFQPVIVTQFAVPEGVRSLREAIAMIQRDVLPQYPGWQLRKLATPGRFGRGEYNPNEPFLLLFLPPNTP